MKPNLNQREDQYAETKQHMDEIKSGDCEPDKVVKEKKSIYDGFIDRHQENLFPEVEKEILRNIKTYEPEVATKRIMELVYITRYEWR